MTPDKSPRRLGRGLDALLGGTGRPGPATPGEKAEPAIAGSQNADTLREIPVSEIRPNQYQPRREFTLAELNELRDSIKAAGLLQPITVRPSASHKGYELIAGERRLRAVKDLGWRTVPAVVRNFDDRNALTLALIENLQREDLNPIEEAAGYARLADEFGLGQSEIAELVGKDRSTVANLLRVLQLPAEVRRMLETGQLTAGHARPLLALQSEDQILPLAREIAQSGMSVRAVEERVRQGAAADQPKRGRPRKRDTRPPEVRQIEDSLRRRLQTDVAVVTKAKQRGEVRINFYSYDDLDRLMELLGARE